VTAARRKGEPELLTLTEAARRCGVSRSRMRRALDDGALPNAVQADDERGTWQVPVSDLVAAGYLDTAEQVGTGRGQVSELVATDTGQVATDTGQVTEQVGPGVGLVRWEDVQGLVAQLVTAQDDRARAETDLRVATFRLEQAEAELQRLRDEQAAARAQAQAPEADPGGRTGWWRRR
jgi:hypothetical protein